MVDQPEPPPQTSMFGLRQDRSTFPVNASSHNTRPGESGVEAVGTRLEGERAGKVVHPEVAPRGALQEILDFESGSATASSGATSTGTSSRHRQPERPGQLAADHLGHQRVQSLAGGPPLDHLGAEVVALHQPRQRPALAQRGDVPDRGDGGQHSAATLSAA